MSKLKQLSGLDASFIYLDTDRASTGGTMIYVYDQSTIPGGGHLRFKEILKHIESRTATSPIFRQKLKQVPMSLDYPYWVEDENFPAQARRLAAVLYHGLAPDHPPFRFQSPSVGDVRG